MPLLTTDRLEESRTKRRNRLQRLVGLLLLLLREISGSDLGCTRFIEILFHPSRQILGLYFYIGQTCYIPSVHL